MVVDFICVIVCFLCAIVIAIVACIFLCYQCVVFYLAICNASFRWLFIFIVSILLW